MLSPFVQRKIAWAFCKYDQSQNGLIEKEDVLLIAKRVAESFGFKEGDRKYQEIVDAYAKVWDYNFTPVDTDGDGKITLLDYLEARNKMYPNSVGKTQEAYNLMFDCLDVDGNGTISFKEYEIYLKALGETNSEIIKRGFESIDINKDGLISREEYAKIRSDYFNSEDPEDPSKWFYGAF